MSQETVTLPASEHPEPLQSMRLGAEDGTRQLHATVVLNPPAVWHELTAPYIAARPPARFLTYAELAAKAGAETAVVDEVTAYLRDRGLRIVDISIAARTIRVEGTAAAMTAAFGATLEAHLMNGRRHTVQRGALHLPAGIARHVHAVLGLDDRPAASRPRSHAASAVAGTSAGVTVPPYPAPAIAGFYGFPAATGKGRRVALIEFGGGYSDDVLTAYFQAVLGKAGPSVTAVEVLGAQSTPGAGEYVEVLLDIEVAGAIAPEAAYLVVFAPNTFDAWLPALDAALAWSGGAPDTISISWGSPEESWPAAAREAFDQALQSAAALGVTVIVAAGDSGVNPQNGVPTVWYPASSSFALGCGGTTIEASSSAITSEVVWNDSSGATGGGISAVVPRPSWQQKLDMPATLVPRGLAGRGVPDVAGNASVNSGYSILILAEPPVWIPGGGTSAVAPLYAGLVARLAQLRAAPLGFVNAALYAASSTAAVFSEITQGNNSFDSITGYAASPGWNACTGCGRPDGAAWKALFAPPPS